VIGAMLFMLLTAASLFGLSNYNYHLESPGSFITISVFGSLGLVVIMLIAYVFMREEDKRRGDILKAGFLIIAPICSAIVYGVIKLVANDKFVFQRVAYEGFGVRVIKDKWTTEQMYEEGVRYLNAMFENDVISKINLSDLIVNSNNDIFTLHANINQSAAEIIAAAAVSSSSWMDSQIFSIFGDNTILIFIALGVTFGLASCSLIVAWYNGYQIAIIAQTLAALQSRFADMNPKMVLELLRKYESQNASALNHVCNYELRLVELICALYNLALRLGDPELASNIRVVAFWMIELATPMGREYLQPRLGEVIEFHALEED
jgi:hypothetical protein